MMNKKDSKSSTKKKPEPPEWWAQYKKNNPDDKDEYNPNIHCCDHFWKDFCQCVKDARWLENRERKDSIRDKWDEVRERMRPYFNDIINVHGDIYKLVYKKYKIMMYYPTTSLLLDPKTKWQRYLSVSMFEKYFEFLKEWKKEFDLKYPSRKPVS